MPDLFHGANVLAGCHARGWSVGSRWAKGARAAEGPRTEYVRGIEVAAGTTEVICEGNEGEADGRLEVPEGDARSNKPRCCASIRGGVSRVALE